MSRQYTDKEKIAYYKSLALSSQKPVYNSRSTYTAKSSYNRKPPAPAQSAGYLKPRYTKKTVVRRPGTLSGYGAYTKNGVKKQKSIGQRIGSQIGSALGMGAEHLVKWLTGMGDYEVKQNALLVQDPPPMVNKSNKGGVLVRHREYLQDIITSSTASTFKLDAFYINPADPNTFPWLSQVAQNYEQYSLEGVIFEFRSMSADALNSTNTALGSVILATEYNSLDANFQNKSEMENHEFGASCKPSQDIMHPIECAPSQTSITELYTRSGALPTGADRRLYDWGKFQIATVGFQGTSVNVGELWVTYQVRLIKPKLYSILGLDIGAYFSNNSSYTNLLPLGNGTINPSFFDNMGLNVDAPNRQIIFPRLGVPRAYNVCIQWIGTLAAVTYPALTYANCSTRNFFSQGAAPLVGPAGGESCTSCFLGTTVLVQPFTGTDASITFGAAGVLPSSGSSVRIRVMQHNNIGFN